MFRWLGKYLRYLAKHQGLCYRLITELPDGITGWWTVRVRVEVSGKKAEWFYGFNVAG
ncbi:MAG: hypothetical protein ACE5GD_07200 [Candidatus Geothermarchaeales archaeon]